MNPAALQDWVPLRFFARNNRDLVDWMFAGEDRFTDPFFEQTVSRRLSHPADVLFRHQTPVKVLREIYEQRRGLGPTGFIFHMSRCGSTLISQMLAAIERNIVISEARPIDQVLRANLPEEQRVELLRWTINAFAQPRAGENYFFIKFDAWHVLQLLLIARAFPNTPWIFVYRDPIEVLVSQHRERGVQVIPGAMNPAVFGLDPREAWFTKLDEYAARVLGRICVAAYEHRAIGRGWFVHFSELPNIVPGLARNCFGATFSEIEMERLCNVAQFDAKRPGLNYESDSVAKQREATDELKELAAKFIQPAYEELERARSEQRPV